MDKGSIWLWVFALLIGSAKVISFVVAVRRALKPKPKQGPRSDHGGGYDPPQDSPEPWPFHPRSSVLSKD